MSDAIALRGGRRCGAFLCLLEFFSQRCDLGFKVFISGFSNSQVRSKDNGFIVTCIALVLVATDYGLGPDLVVFGGVVVLHFYLVVC